MLDAADAVGYGPEVADAQLLLLLHAERAVVGGDHGEVVGAQPLPQLVLVVVVVRPDRGRAHVGRAVPALVEVLFEAEVEILRAGLGEHVGAVGAGDGYLLQRLLGRQVHDVEGGGAHLGQLDGPVGGLRLELGPAHVAVGHRVGLAPLVGLLGQHVDGDPVLGVHHYEPAVAGALLHGPQDLAVVAVEHAGVGHEELEAGDPLVHQQVHLFEGGVGDVADDHVEAVVDGAAAFGLLHAGVEALAHVEPVALGGEVDDGGGAAPGRGPGAGLEVVGRDGAAERQLHVGVHVHPAGHHQLAGGVDHPVSPVLG